MDDDLFSDVKPVAKKKAPPQRFFISRGSWGKSPEMKYQMRIDGEPFYLTQDDMDNLLKEAKGANEKGKN